MYIVDFLSRCGMNKFEKFEQSMLEMVHCLTERGIVHFSYEWLEEFKNEIITYEVLVKVD